MVNAARELLEWSCSKAFLEVQSGGAWCGSACLHRIGRGLPRDPHGVAAPPFSEVSDPFRDRFGPFSAIFGPFGPFPSPFRASFRAPRTHRCVRRQLSRVDFEPCVLPEALLAAFRALRKLLLASFSSREEAQVVQAHASY